MNRHCLTRLRPLVSIRTQGRQYCVARNGQSFLKRHNPHPAIFSSARLSTTAEQQPLSSAAAAHDDKTDVQIDRLTAIEKLATYAKNGQAEQADKVYQKLLEKYNETGDPRFRPTGTVLAHVLSALSSNGEGERAESILKENNSTLNTVHYNIALNAWAKSGHLDAPQRAEALLESMKDNSNCRPDYLSYGTVLKCWLRSGQEDAVEHSIDMLGRMEVVAELTGDSSFLPTTISFNLVLDQIAKSNKPDYDRAVALFNRMKELSSSGFYDSRPSKVTYGTLLNCLSRSQIEDKGDTAVSLLEEMFSSQDETVRPTTRFCNTVMNLLVNEPGSRKDPRRIEKILTHMELLYKKGNTQIKPDAISYTTAITGWAKSDDVLAVSRAQAIFGRLLKLSDDGDTSLQASVVVFTAMISVFIRARHNVDGGHRALKYLEELKSRYKAGQDQYKPNTSVYNATLSAVCQGPRRLRAKRALALLEDMKNDPTISPDRVTYKAALKALRMSDHPEKKELAQKLTEEMNQLGR